MPDTPTFFCIPTIRLGEVANAIQRFDSNFVRYGHKVPILLFADSSPLDYPEEYKQLQCAARESKNDIFIITPEAKREFIAQIMQGLRAQTGLPSNEELMVYQALTESLGGNRNCALLYTFGSHIVLCDDDIKPYSLTTTASNTSHFDESVIWAGRECSTSESAYAMLSQSFDKMRDQIRQFDCELSEPDLLGSLLAPLGQSADDLGDSVERALTMRYSDRYLYTATTLGNYPSLQEMGRSLESSKELNQPLAPLESTSIQGNGIKPCPYYLQLHGAPRKEKGRIRIVAPAIGLGVPDYDASDFLRYAVKHPEVEGRYEIKSLLVADYISSKVAVLDKHYSISGQIAAVINDESIGPNFLDFRMDDWGIRLDSLRKGTLTAIAPLCVLHSQSPQGRSSLGNTYYLETLGEHAKILLLSARQTDGSFKLDMGLFTKQIAKQIVDEAKAYVSDIKKQLSASGLPAKRREFLEELANDIELNFCNLDHQAFYEHAYDKLHDRTKLYIHTQELWPRLQHLAASLQNTLMLTHVATGSKISVRQLMQR